MPKYRTNQASFIKQMPFWLFWRAREGPPPQQVVKVDSERTMPTSNDARFEPCRGCSPLGFSCCHFWRRNRATIRRIPVGSSWKGGG